MTAAQFNPYLPWLILVAFLIVFLLVFYTLFAWLSGWRALAKQYRASEAVAGWEYSPFWVALKHPSLSYRSWLTFYVGDQGLGIRAPFLMRFVHPTLLIPWRDIQYRGERKYFLATVARFSLGSPPITSLFLWDTGSSRWKIGRAMKGSAGGSFLDQILSKVHAKLDGTVAPSEFAAASGTSQVALILGALSLFCFGFLAGIPAVILGLKEEQAIAGGEAPQSGKSIARTGWILGLVGTFLWFLIVITLGFIQSHYP